MACQPFISIASLFSTIAAKANYSKRAWAREASGGRLRCSCSQASPPELTAIIDTLAATLPGYGSIPFILDEDFNIAEGLIRMVGVGQTVRWDKMPALAKRILKRR
jgi:hypothetical protein